MTIVSMAEAVSGIVVCVLAIMATLLFLTASILSVGLTKHNEENLCPT